MHKLESIVKRASQTCADWHELGHTYAMTDTQNRTLDWTLGDRLRKAREYAGISSTEMADLLDVDRTSISKWENGRTGKRGVSKLVLYRWSQVTGVPVEWLETGEDGHVSRWITERLHTGPPCAA